MSNLIKKQRPEREAEHQNYFSSSIAVNMSYSFDGFSGQGGQKSDSDSETDSSLPDNCRE